jgi:hypothetical protein
MRAPQVEPQVSRAVESIVAFALSKHIRLTKFNLTRSSYLEIGWQFFRNKSILSQYAVRLKRVQFI